MCTANRGILVIGIGYVKSPGYQNATADINCNCGILYAQLPLGDLKWRKPRPIETSNDFSGQSTNATKVAPAYYHSLPLWSHLQPESQWVRL
jgi:hypothetical protein